MPDWVEDLLVRWMHMDHWHIGCLCLTFQQWPLEHICSSNVFGSLASGLVARGASSRARLRGQWAFWHILALKHTGLVKPCEIMRNLSTETEASKDTSWHGNHLSNRAQPSNCSFEVPWVRSVKRGSHWSLPSYHMLHIASGLFV